MTDRLIIEREFAVRPEELFAAWTDVNVLSRWFGCGNDMLWNVKTWDVREGGAIAVSLDFDGNPYEVRGKFVVVDPPRRLRYRWNHDQSVEIAIEPRGNGSHLRLEHSWPPTNEDRSMLDAGWAGALEQLGRTFAGALAP